MRKEISVFIGLTRSSYNYFLSLKDKDRYNVLVDVNNCYLHEGIDNEWEMVLRPELLHKQGGMLLNKLNEYQNLTILIDKIKNIISNSTSPVKIYYQTLEDVVGNFFYFSKEYNSKIEFYLVEDGLLNYLPERFTFLRIFFLQVKKIFFWFYNIPFHIPYEGEDKGINFLFTSDYRCKKVYVRYPEKSLHANSSKVEPLFSSKIVYTPIPNRVLIIGQEPLALKQFLGNEYGKYFYKLIDKIVEVLPLNCVFYYKKHNLKDKSQFDINDFQGYKGMVFEIVHSLAPIEEIISEICPQFIIGFESTAIFNLKLSIENNVGVEYYAFPIYNPYVKALFYKIGINILE